MSVWSNSYVGMLWTAELYCAGLARLVYERELGIQIPDYGPAPRDCRQWGEAVRRAASAWPWVKLASNAVRNPFDLVVFERSFIDAHVGIVVDGELMLHVQKGSLAKVDPIAHPEWAQHLFGVYRHVQLAGSLAA